MVSLAWVLLNQYGGSIFLTEMLKQWRKSLGIRESLPNAVDVNIDIEQAVVKTWENIHTVCTISCLCSIYTLVHLEAQCVFSVSREEESTRKDVECVRRVVSSSLSSKCVHKLQMRRYQQLSRGSIKNTRFQWLITPPPPFLTVFQYKMKLINH